MLITSNACLAHEGHEIILTPLFLRFRDFNISFPTFISLTGSSDKEKLHNAIEEIRSQGAKVIIGPIDYQDFEEVKKYSNLTFISPSNINPEFQNNIISIGISFESQMMALVKFIKKQKKSKTVILIPRNNYTNLIEKTNIL